MIAALLAVAAAVQPALAGVDETLDTHTKQFLNFDGNADWVEVPQFTFNNSDTGVTFEIVARHSKLVSWTRYV